MGQTAENVPGPRDARTGGKRQKLTCPLTTKLVFNIVSLSGKEFNEFILELLHDALTLSTQGRKR